VNYVTYLKNYVTIKSIKRANIADVLTEEKIPETKMKFLQMFCPLLLKPEQKQNLEMGIYFSDIVFN